MMADRKRKLSAEIPPEDEEDVIGPLPVGAEKGTKKRKGTQTSSTVKMCSIKRGAGNLNLYSE